MSPKGKLNDQKVINEFADMIITPYRLADCILDPTKLHNRRLDGTEADREIVVPEFIQLIKGKTIIY